MTKVVYNACFGGFGLSNEGVKRYCELKGIGFYPEAENSLITIYWTVPPEERAGYVHWRNRKGHSDEALEDSNRLYRESTIHVSEIPRTDRTLVQVVEELGAAANGRFANLCIEDVPPGTQYRIDEYDGNESVMTNGDYEWSVA